VSKYPKGDYRAKRPVRRGSWERLLKLSDETRTRGGRKSRRRTARKWEQT
jgi:hypothetical protein